MNQASLIALASAVLFGASTPIAKAWMVDASPWWMAGFMYLGSGLGLSICRFIRDGGFKRVQLQPTEWRWFLGAVIMGGVLGPVALLMGLQRTSASTASLLLNLESVLTALIAWVVFKEHAHQRLVWGMLAIALGGCLLAGSMSAHASGDHSGLIGIVFIVLACACWAIDNNLTRHVSASDAWWLASTKGWIAGLTNLTMAWMLHPQIPPSTQILKMLTLGFAGYGLSLVLFVLALRRLGTARTGAYFATAPFVGAFLAVMIGGESTHPVFWLATAFMMLGVYLHLSEHHAHEHTHEVIIHSHAHTHDEHHQHSHNEPWASSRLHEHEHRHEALTHHHEHYPDIHHQHRHS